MTSTLLSRIAWLTLFGIELDDADLVLGVGLCDLLGAEDHDLVRRDAVLPQNDLQQFDVARRAADHAEALADDLLDLLDRLGLRRRLLALGGLRRRVSGARHDEHHDVLAQDRDHLAVLRHAGVAPDDGEIGLALVDSGCGLGRAPRQHVDAQADIGAVARELRRERLHHAGVLAVGRTDGDLELGRLVGEMVRHGNQAAAQQQDRQNDQRRVPQHDLDAAAGIAERRSFCGRLLHQGFSHSEPGGAACCAFRAVYHGRLASRRQRSEPETVR